MDATTGPTLAPGASGRETPPREIKKRSTATSATAGLARARPPTRHTASASAALSSQRRPYRRLCAEAGGERRRTAGRARLPTTAYTVFASRGHCEENRSALIRLSAFVLPISLHALAAKRWTSDTRPYSILVGSPAKSLGEVSCWASSGPVRLRIKPVLNRSANDVSDNEPIPTVREQIPRRIVDTTRLTQSRKPQGDSQTWAAKAAAQKCVSDSSLNLATKLHLSSSDVQECVAPSVCHCLVNQWQEWGARGSVAIFGRL